MNKTDREIIDRVVELFLIYGLKVVQERSNTGVLTMNIVPAIDIWSQKQPSPEGLLLSVKQIIQQRIEKSRLPTRKSVAPPPTKSKNDVQAFLGTADAKPSKRDGQENTIFVFKEGYSNAVRKPVFMQLFM